MIKTGKSRREKKRRYIISTSCITNRQGREGKRKENIQADKGIEEEWKNG